MPGAVGGEGRGLGFEPVLIRLSCHEEGWAEVDNHLLGVNLTKSALQLLISILRDNNP